MVRRLHPAHTGAGAARHKVAHTLAGGTVVATAQLVSAALPLALQHHPAQRVKAARSVGGVQAHRAKQGFKHSWVGGVVARVNAHHQAGIGIALVARILAHAVGHHPARFGSGRHHRAARAHAKAVDAAPIAGVVHQFVIGRAQHGVTGVCAPARAVDHALRVLDAKAQRKRFGLHGHAMAVQHGEGVACAVPQGQHHMACGQGVAQACGQVEHLQRHNALALWAVFGFDVGHALLKANLAAQADDVLAQVLHHLDQLKGANVRVCGPQNLFRCTKAHKLGHHLAPQMARVFDLAVELAVAEGAGTAFAKLHIALGLQHMLAPQAPGVFGALAHAAPAFDDDGLQAHLRQHQGGKHAARPKANHHRPLSLHGGPVGRCLHRGMPSHVGAGKDVGVVHVAGQAVGLLLVTDQLHVHDVDHLQLGFAGIKAALEHLPMRDVGGVYAQGVGHQLGQAGRVQRGRGGCVGRVKGGVERELEFGDADHGHAARGHRARTGEARIIGLGG